VDKVRVEPPVYGEFNVEGENEAEPSNGRVNVENEIGFENPAIVVTEIE